MPHCLWIFDMQGLRQSSLIVQSSTRQNIRSVKWNPVVPEQFVFLSTRLSDLESDGATRSDARSHIYFWKGEAFGGLEAIEVPAGNSLFCILNSLW